MARPRFDAVDALRVGLVHQVVAPDQLVEQVNAFAHELAAFPAEAVGASKLVIGASVDADRTGQRLLEKFANTSLVGRSENQTARFSVSLSGTVTPFSGPGATTARQVPELDHNGDFFPRL